MGCGSSTKMVSATGDNLVHPHRVTTPDTVPTEEDVLRDLPDVVEKVINVLKYNGHTNNIETSHELSSTVENTHAAVDDNKFANDTDSDNSAPGIIQGFLPDTISMNSNQSDLEYIKENYNLALAGSADDDSLRTSSPESEIEEALANSNDQNPPTPKPTFAELKDLVLLPTSLIHNYYPLATSNDQNHPPTKYTGMYPINTADKNANGEGDSLRQLGEKANKNFNSSNKSKYSNPAVPKQPTEWEIQADMLASTQKYNPIDALRKFRKENRSNSSLPNRRDNKPKIQRYFEEDLSEFFAMESPLRSGLSSARSERGSKPHLSDPDPNYIVNSTQTDSTNNAKVQEVKKKSENKQKETHLTVSHNGRGLPSPSLYKVRERCAVCSKKYKH